MHEDIILVQIPIIFWSESIWLPGKLDCHFKSAYGNGPIVITHKNRELANTTCLSLLVISRWLHSITKHRRKSLTKISWKHFPLHYSYWFSSDILLILIWILFGTRHEKSLLWVDNCNSWIVWGKKHSLDKLYEHTLPSALRTVLQSISFHCPDSLTLQFPVLFLRMPHWFSAGKQGSALICQQGVARGTDWPRLPLHANIYPGMMVVDYGTVKWGYAWRLTVFLQPCHSCRPGWRLGNGMMYFATHSTSNLCFFLTRLRPLGHKTTYEMESL